MQNYDSTHDFYVTPTPNSVDVKRKPVQGTRAQDNSTTANVGKTRVQEGGSTSVMFPKGGTQPTQPNPSSLRQ